jgi:catechol 2,3-dioxygenase-like lactoylglutathione lyase family enzyme
MIAALLTQSVIAESTGLYPAGFAHQQQLQSGVDSADNYWFMQEIHMETIISDLVKRFEKGGLTRRELIQGLALLTTAGVTSSGAASQDAASLKTTRIDHVSIQVTDLPRSVAFYRSVFGLSVVGEDKANEIVRLGKTRALVSLHHKSPTGLVDHYAIAVDGFNREAVTQELKRRGLNPQDNIDAGFHIQDPEGINVQIVQS